MKELIFNLVNGVWSGIPMCCTLFFTYKAVVLKDGLVYATVYADRPKDHDYVVCNRCYAKNKIKEIRNNGVILEWLIRDAD